MLVEQRREIFVQCMHESEQEEIPVFEGWESGHRKRYLKSLEDDLASELGPDWREKIANNSAD